MKLIIGLGNPGKQYENTRHNAGFILLDEIQKALSFPEFEFKKKFNAEISEKNIDGEKTILAKPQTFMNLSGQSVQAIMAFYKISIEDVTVAHDDLDIEIGQWKISQDSRAAGHNGVQSIFDQLATQKIKRIRIGVEKIGGRAERVESGIDFVLKDFTKEESEKLNIAILEIVKDLG
jgi:PTH1 family peptidyl-tRNA hydrolase